MVCCEWVVVVDGLSVMFVSGDVLCVECVVVVNGVVVCMLLFELLLCLKKGYLLIIDCYLGYVLY